MRTLKFALLLLITSVCGINANAQGRFGKTPEDSIQCLLNNQSYETEYKSKNYEAALPGWRKVLEICPTLSQNVYVRGVTLMRYLIDNTYDPALKEARIDSLLMLYDKRLEYFNVKDKDRRDVLFNKAMYLQTYRPDNEKDIYNAYMNVIDDDKKRGTLSVDLSTVAQVMLLGKSLYEKGELTAADFTNLYTDMADIADAQVVADPSDTLKDGLKSAIESAFLITDAANCENLNTILGDKFKNNRDNAEEVRKIVALLTTKDCTDTELYYEGVETYNKLNPSPSASYGLARMYYSRKDRDKAMQYFKDAVELEKDATNKSKYFQEFATLMQHEGNIGLAISYAKQSIAANPRNGKAYYILGTSYARVTSCDGAVSRGSVFWAAVDQLNRAKQLDASLAADANKQISMFSQHFPTTADVFMELNLTNGAKYTVQCGPINEVTTVRTR